MENEGMVDVVKGLGEDRKRMVCFFFNDTATTEIYTLSLHDALPISGISFDLLTGFNTAELRQLQVEQNETGANGP